MPSALVSSRAAHVPVPVPEIFRERLPERERVYAAASLIAAPRGADDKLAATVGPLANILHRDVLRSLVDDRTFERGQQYFTQGRVSDVSKHEASLVGNVRGSAMYRVRLWVKDDGLAYSCTCPMGAEGAFCKHGVAVGLTWLDGLDQPRKDASLDVVRSYLQQLDKQALVELVMKEAAQNTRLREQLTRKASS